MTVSNAIRQPKTSLGARLALCIALLSVTGNIAAQVEEVDDGAPIAAVINGVREALTEAQTYNVPGFPPLTNVQITLQSKARAPEGGGVRFLIFTLGSKRVTENASSLAVRMSPPPTTDAAGISGAYDLESALAQAIQTAKIGILEANELDPPLLTSQVDISVKFTISDTDEGSIDTADLLPLGLSENRRASRNQVQEIALTFSNSGSSE